MADIDNDKMFRIQTAINWRAKHHPVYYLAMAIGEPRVLLVVPDGTEATGSKILAVGKDMAHMWLDLADSTQAKPEWR